MPVVKKRFRRGPGRAGVLPSVGDSGGVRGRALVGCRLSGIPEGCGVARWWVVVCEATVLDAHIDTRQSWRVPRQLSHILLPDEGEFHVNCHSRGEFHVNCQTLVHKPAYLATTRGPDKPGCGAVADAVLAKK